jgi:precorrin-6x reductase
MPLDLSTHAMHTDLNGAVTSVRDAVAICQAASEVIEDVVVALGLHATARVKDGQGELMLRLIEPPPVRARVVD